MRFLPVYMCSALYKNLYTHNAYAQIQIDKLWTFNCLQLIWKSLRQETQPRQLGACFPSCLVACTCVSCFDAYSIMSFLPDSRFSCRKKRLFLIAGICPSSISRLPFCRQRVWPRKNTIFHLVNWKLRCTSIYLDKKLNPNLTFNCFNAQSPLIDELYVVQKSWSSDFETPNLWNVWSGYAEV